MFSLQSCPVLCHPMDCSLSGSPVHGILWARIVEWVAKSYSRGYYLPRDQTCNSFVSCIGRQLLYYYCHLDSVQFSSVGQLYLTLCDPMDCSTPGFTAHHQLSELAQTHAIESVMPSNHSPNSTGGLTPFRPLSSLQEIHVGTLEESRVRCFPSNRGLTTWVSLEWDPEIRVAPVEENSVHMRP